ncbi:hypothetical protein CDD81_5324 [Ophiocordyceps australis]|uniref:Protein kinase domain-containing protein n=1 Tax=Ophiocordyceps australis TaxID=1399860 RepID=A0A2C5YI54_9HYPO|nr:hypothetical protein CDD81_5324 [Ophiocordyceps australis]
MTQHAIPACRPPSTSCGPNNTHPSFSAAPMLAASSSSSHHSLASVDRNGQPATSFDFLPSASFDHLQSTIQSASSSSSYNLSQFPSPTDASHVLGASPEPDKPAMKQPASQSRSANTASCAAPSTSRSSRPASVFRRGSTSSRHASTSSILSTSSQGNSEAAAPPRARRQSHYPPLTSTNVGPRPPRKSIGPALSTDGDGERRASRSRRPSLLGERAPAANNAPRLSIDAASRAAADGLGSAGSSRAAKAKSVQPPARPSQANLLSGHNLALENNRLSALPRSPRAASKGLTAPALGKRASMMPVSHHSSHATGLGARTISPTDTRRMKRLSTMPQSQSLNLLTGIPPPPPVMVDARAQSPSPSMIPRKATGTPSSARTTPDTNNRKSYSSGLSVGSTASSNTVRTSTGSLQPRIPQSASASRLPAPKHTTVHNPLPTEEEEDVPPVPAIPKAYESPKDSPADAYFAEKKRKTSLAPADLTLGFGGSSGTITMPVHPEPVKAPQRPVARKSTAVAAGSTQNEKARTQDKKQLQPLRLPPLNMGPLNLPTAAKVAALRDQTNADRDLSPPPSRQLHKTPSTPMTASKSAFFSKTKIDSTIELPQIRSSSSVHRTYRVTSTPPDADTSDSSISAPDKPSISPFLSSSLPKGGLEHGFIKRSRTGGDFATITGNVFDDRNQQKPAGPREPKTGRPLKSPPPEQTPPEPSTPSSMNSLRRKFSLSWKRGNSKGSISGTGDVDTKSSAQHAKHDSVQTARIPASATSNSLLSAKHEANDMAVGSNEGLLDLKRRKNSAASLVNNATNDRVRSDTWAIKKESMEPGPLTSHRPVTSTTSRLLKPKASSSGLRSTSYYSATELDRDDVAADEEMRKMGSRRKETDVAARALDALKMRATPKECVGPHEAIQIAMLNIYERGEIVDFDDVYFCGTQNANKVVGEVQSEAPNFGYDDERGDYTIVPGDHLAYRYEIIDILGKGSFGQVVRCIDHKLGVLVAIKIIRNKKRFHQQALVEVNILQKLREWDGKDKHSMVCFTQHFYFRGHLCISTELLDMNLYEFIKAHAFRGFSLRIIRRFTKQILSALILLKQRKVIHCDLKPENILLRHPLHSEIKVIDFGSSCFENEKVYTYIQSRFYRSPEVILGMTYGMPIDMWSVGCILAELYTGVPIFPGENEQEQLACIMEVFGPPEKHLIEKSTRKKLFFDSMGKPRLTVSSKGRRRRPSSKTLQQVLKCEDEVFVDFLARCLRWDPERRMKPEEAIRHEYLTGQKPVPVPRMPARESSPVKRLNANSTPRPLPDPPGASAKAANNSVRAGNSPTKPVSGAVKRTSGSMAPIAASSRRVSGANGSNGAGTSSLPRAAGRAASGRQDLAAAGAMAAMTRRT